MYINVTCQSRFFIGKIMKKIINITIIIFLALASLAFNKQTQAEVYCDDQYGGNCREIELQIDKLIYDPESNNFVDNLGINDYKFGNGEQITFKLKIKNNGEETFKHIDVRDYLPDYVQHLNGDLSFEITDLVVNETEEREITVKVVNADKMPEGKSIICVVNKAEAWNGSDSDSDTAQFCIEEKVLGMTTIPKTGANLISAIILLIVAFSFGFYRIGKSFFKKSN